KDASAIQTVASIQRSQLKRSDSLDQIKGQMKGREDPTADRRPCDSKLFNRHSSTIEVAFTRGRRKRSGLSLQVTSVCSQISPNPRKSPRKFRNENVTRNPR
ncbi:hypothetical protein A2U01_0039618, partial [Trifolium medium]|nr:hypothetical protein [Trifolium medium]